MIYLWIFIISLFIIIMLQLFKKKLLKGNKTLGITILKIMTMVISLILFVIIAVSGIMFYNFKTSELPGSISMIDHNNLDYGGGAMHDDSMFHTSNISDAVSVTELTDGVENLIADKKYTLKAEKVTTTLSSGKTIDTWRFTGKDGSDIRVKQNEIIEVRLINENITKGVSIHWHGYDVPNAMDGVTGMTQDAVMPGESFIYKFRAKDPGTYWFHSHQNSFMQVYKGLFGTLIVEPEGELFPYDEEILVPLHVYITNQGMISTVDLFDTLQKKRIDDGKRVRVRLINTDNQPHEFRIEGAAFKLIAVDGTYLHDPQEVRNKRLLLGAGGRYDVLFTMPDNIVEIKEKGFSFSSLKTIILLTNDGEGEETIGDRNMPLLDLENYGVYQKTEFDINSSFDRNFNMILGSRFGFYNGKPAYLWTINGEVFPNTPTFVVREGELIKVNIENRSPEPHPMHLHGHHALVLSKDGKSVKGSPWWTDSLNVMPGEEYEIGFYADNPGLWMDHCHNLQHASVGMILHLMYEGITTPYMIGEDTGNMPE